MRSFLVGSLVLVATLGLLVSRDPRGLFAPAGAVADGGALRASGAERERKISYTYMSARHLTPDLRGSSLSLHFCRLIAAGL